MEKKVKEQSMTFTMRLLREKISIGKSLKPGHGLREYPWQGVEGAKLFVGSAFGNPPAWADFIKAGIPDFEDLNLFNQGTAAILFVPVQGRIMAFCLGHVHIVMDLDACERNFGLKVTLNSVPRQNIRSFDSATPDAVSVQHRIQTSCNSDLGMFELDFTRDLIQSMAGTPDNLSFAKFVSGKDNLRLTCHVSPATIKEKCRQALTFYNSDHYKLDYEWIDHVRKVRDKETIALLDNQLFQALARLREGQQSDLHMSPPEIVDYMEGAAIHYNGFHSRQTTFYEVKIEDYVSELNRCGFSGSIQQIKETHKIATGKEGQGKFVQKWKVYESFIFESYIKKVRYVLFAGSWYQIDRDFADEINTFYDSIDKLAIIPETDRSNEQLLISELDKRPDFVNLDQAKLNPKGTKYANLEPCDFFSDKRQFIHIKDGHSSKPISHLWMQGLVSAESFAGDSEFRKKLRGKVKMIKPGFETYLPDGRTQRPDTSDYQIVFAIMRKPYASGEVGLPFFSKVSLRNVIRRLDAMGYKTAINLIRKISNATETREAA